MEERFQKAREQNKKIFGEPVFQQSSVRGFDEGTNEGGWDMMVEAKAVDIAHRIDAGKVEELFQSIVDDPPELKAEKEHEVYGEFVYVL